MKIVVALQLFVKFSSIKFNENSPSDSPFVSRVVTDEICKLKTGSWRRVANASKREVHLSWVQMFATP
jgi:hypothetical protein